MTQTGTLLCSSSSMLSSPTTPGYSRITHVALGSSPANGFSSISGNPMALLTGTRPDGLFAASTNGQGSTSVKLSPWSSNLRQSGQCSPWSHPSDSRHTTWTSPTPYFTTICRKLCTIVSRLALRIQHDLMPCASSVSPSTAFVKHHGNGFFASSPTLPVLASYSRAPTPPSSCSDEAMTPHTFSSTSTT
jgi:hypothetical protein